MCQRGGTGASPSWQKPAIGTGLSYNVGGHLNYRYMPHRSLRRSSAVPPVKLSKRAQRPPVEPADALSQKFSAAILQFSADFLKTKGFKHALTKGEQREAPVQDFLRQNLPDVFGVAAGEVIDSLGTHSPQLDVLVFDRIRNFPVHRGSAVILPAEALGIVRGQEHADPGRDRALALCRR